MANPGAMTMNMNMNMNMMRHPQAALATAATGMPYATYVVLI